MKYLPLLLIVVTLLSGCVYYNTFYNARQYFKTAQDEPLKDTGKPSRTAIQNYNKAMQKCGIILTDYKESKWTDDALFMMAQSLYYRKTKLLEARIKFEEVIDLFPESDFAQRAPIYIARCYYETNQEEKAYQKLRDFIVSGVSLKYLPEAINLMAEYYLEEADYTQAEYYYQKIIDEYPKSDLHEASYFSLGLLYHRNEEYDKSIGIFEDFLKIKADKKKKLEARYYIANNNLLAENLELAMKQIDKLLKDEYRTNELNKIFLLKARVLANSDATEEADIIFDQLITENPKTTLSAEASFWRAEMHFRILNNYELAIEYYNNVRTENAHSEFIERAVTHSAVASQIVQYNSANADIELGQLIDEQMKLAEYYVEVLALPDSAMAVYDRIISHPEAIAAKIDTMQSELDSLLIFQDELARQDSIAENTIEVPAIVDSMTYDIMDEFGLDDTLAVVDTLAIIDTLAVIDTLEMTLIDSVFTPEPEPEKVEVKPTYADTLSEYITTAQGQIQQYNDKFIPYVQFVKLWMQKTVYDDSLATQQLFDYLLTEYPENRYTYAARQFMNNQPVDFLLPEEKIEQTTLQKALGYIPAQTDSAIVLLKTLSADSTAAFFEQSLYTIGYIHYQLEADTLSAKPIFDRLLHFDRTSLWCENIELVYDGDNFLFLDRLPALVDLEQQELEALEAEMEAEMEEEVLEDEEIIMELEDIEKPAADIPDDTEQQRSQDPPK